MINGFYPFIQCRYLLYSGEDTQNLILLQLALGGHSTVQEDAFFICLHCPKRNFILREFSELKDSLLWAWR